MAQRVLAVIETVTFLAAVLLPGGSFFRRMTAFWTPGTRSRPWFPRSRSQRGSL